ncbi:DNA-binding protein [Paenibacillus sp. MMO-58]|uniref:DNA-binding protein n=1 Tax=Paenibacillus sp. MMO-58 TaxID=3081290 RepID=UPI003015DE7E
MSGLTKDAIFAAANALQAEGFTPTVATVREKLGKGSFTTINEVMREWRESQKAPEAPAKEVAPQAVVDSLMEFGNTLWKVASDLAVESLKSDREGLEQMKHAMEEEQRETVAFADNMSNKVDALEAKAEELIFQLELEQNGHEATRSLYTVLTDEAIKLRSDLEAAKQRVEDFKEQSHGYKASLEQAQREIKIYSEREIQRESLVVKLESEIESLKKERNQQIANMTRDLEKERDKAEKAEKAFEAERATAQAALIEKAQLEGELKALKALVEAAQAKQEKSGDDKQQ